MKDQPTGTTPERYYRYCPRCGAPLILAYVEEQQRLVCTAGDFVFYQNPHAAVAALTFNERGEVLLTEQLNEPLRGHWDVPGGFVDWGEQPRDAIVRELAEELHVRFTPGPLVGAYHGWYDARGLAVSCAVIYYSGSLVGTPQPDSDVAQCRWFPLDRLPSNLRFEHIERAIEAYRYSVH